MCFIHPSSVHPPIFFLLFNLFCSNDCAVGWQQDRFVAKVCFVLRLMTEPSAIKLYSKGWQLTVSSVSLLCSKAQGGCWWGPRSSSMLSTIRPTVILGHCKAHRFGQLNELLFPDCPGGYILLLMVQKH